MKGMQLFDNYEEDGQLSLFSADYDDWDDDWEEMPEEGESEEPSENREPETSVKAGEDSGVKAAKAKGNTSAKTKNKSGNGAGASESKTVSIGAAVDTYEKAVAGLEMTGAGPTVRVKYCASCGKLLFVKEEPTGFHSECNNCGIKYFQKL